MFKLQFDQQRYEWPGSASLHPDRISLFCAKNVKMTVTTITNQIAPQAVLWFQFFLCHFTFHLEQKGKSWRIFRVHCCINRLKFGTLQHFCIFLKSRCCLLAVQPSNCDILNRSSQQVLPDLSKPLGIEPRRTTSGPLRISSCLIFRRDERKKLALLLFCGPYCLQHLSSTSVLKNG